MSVSRLLGHEGYSLRVAVLLEQAFLVLCKALSASSTHLLFLMILNPTSSRSSGVVIVSTFYDNNSRTNRSVSDFFQSSNLKLEVALSEQPEFHKRSRALSLTQFSVIMATVTTQQLPHDVEFQNFI